MQRIIVCLVLFIFFASYTFSQDSLSTIQITSEPSGAQIYFDDELSGSTPHTLMRIPAGKHIIKLSRNGYEDWITTLNAAFIDTNYIHAILNPHQGQIQFNCDIENAYIFLDSKFAGQTPKLIRDIQFGKHYIEISKSRHPSRFNEVPTYKDTIDINDTNIFLVDALLDKCWISINTYPGTGETEIDGKFIGVSPIIKKEIHPGNHEILVKKENFESINHEITIKPGQHQNIDLNLTPMSYSNILYRSLLFPGIGQLYADREFRGFLYTVFEISALGGAIFYNSKMADANTNYETKYELYQKSTNENELRVLHQEVQDSYDQVQEYKKYRNILVGTAVAVWLINIIDAHFLGKEIEEINKNISQSLKIPDIYVQTAHSNCSIGLKIVF